MNNSAIVISIDELAELIVTADFCGECDYFTKSYKVNFCRYFNSEDALNKTLSNEPCINACKKYLQKNMKNKITQGA